MEGSNYIPHGIAMGDSYIQTAGSFIRPAPNGLLKMKQTKDSTPVLVTLRSAIALRQNAIEISYKLSAMCLLGGIMIGAFLIMILIPELGSMKNGLQPVHLVALVPGIIAVGIGLMPGKKPQRIPSLTHQEIESMKSTMGLSAELVERTKAQVLVVRDHPAK